MYKICARWNFFCIKKAKKNLLVIWWIWHTLIWMYMKNSNTIFADEINRKLQYYYVATIIIIYMYLLACRFEASGSIELYHMTFDTACSGVCTLINRQPPGFRTRRHSEINCLSFGKSPVAFAASRWWITCMYYGILWNLSRARNQCYSLLLYIHWQVMKV